MQSDRSLIPGNENHFQENRQKIEAFFNLQKSIDEFFKAQAVFHNNVNLFVIAVTKIQGLIPEEYKLTLQEILLPYKILSNNPFSQRNPNNKIEDDMAFIIAVIDENNEAFKKALMAFPDTVSNKGALDNFLAVCEKNPEIVRLMKAATDNSPWLLIKSYADNPFQYLMRYETLLNVIVKHLNDCVKSVANISGTNQLHLIQDKITFLTEQIVRINTNHEIISVCNRGERALGNLLGDLNTQYDPKCQYPNSQLLRNKINTAMSCTNLAKKKIIQGNEDVINSFSVLLDQMLEIDFLHDTLKKPPSYFITDAAAKALCYLSSAGGFLVGLAKQAKQAIYGEDQAQNFKQIDVIKDFQLFILELMELVEFAKEIQRKQATATCRM